MKKVIHIDMDCFYAAVELRDYPELRDKPVAVGGSPSGRGVVCSANYEARKYGVRSAMSSALAMKKCPDLVFLRLHFSKYKKASQEVREILRQYTDTIEPLSLDEAYLDVSESKLCQGSATLMAQEIRRRIFEKTRLTASAGVAPNKFLAKVASDWNKPDGMFVVSPSEMKGFISRLPVGKINGVGKVTEANLKRDGFEYCCQLQEAGLEILKMKYGRTGEWLYNLSCGIDNRQVAQQRQRKSLSTEITFRQNLENKEECLRKLGQIYLELQGRYHHYVERLKRFQLGPGDMVKVFVKMKFDNFKSTTVECPITSELKMGLCHDQQVSLSKGELLANLTETAYERGARPVRLMGLGVKFDYGQQPKDQNDQLELFSELCSEICA